MSLLDKSSLENKSRILVVDDESCVAETMKEYLIAEGFEVKVCSSGPEALEYLENEYVDLILLDVVMPGMCGIKVAKKIKTEQKKISVIPIIMLSAKDSEEDKVSGLEYADDYVTKPFSFEELIARIKAHLRISQLQNELFLSKTRYQLLYENVPEMCISLDMERNISDCNMLFCEYLNINKRDVIGKNILQFFNPIEHNILLTFFNSLQKQKVSTNGNIFKMVRADKEDDAVLVSIRATCIGEHEPELNIIVVMKDVTKSIKLEQQEKLARQQLYRSARLTSIGTLASGTAHEMNNPLAAILGFADAMLHRFSKGENIEKGELVQYLEIIKSEALRCRDVVENLSMFSREYESKSDKISLFDCLHSAMTLMNAHAQKKSVTIKNNIPNDVIVNADAQKIGQVLVNILSNSIDFCDEGSDILIEIDENTDRNGPVRLKIIDKGPGIPKVLLPKIFDPFYSTKDVGKGIGLGMSISHKLMEECKGSIDVVSEENVGTTVILEIPRN